MSLAFSFYTALGNVMHPLLALWLRARGAKEDAARLAERSGAASRPRPPGALIWLHAASLGEARALLTLRPALPERAALLFTTGTRTAAGLVAAQNDTRLIHQYLPADIPRCVRRFLNHWQPDAVLWTESDFWPVLLTAIKARRIPALLVNGRMSARSAQGWRRAPDLARHMLSAFSEILAQSPADAQRFTGLGAARVSCHGNLKHAAPPLPDDAPARDEWQQAIGARPCWLFASTHAGEERLAAQIHRALKAEYPGLLTLMAPRHPQRAAQIVRELAPYGVKAQRRTHARRPLPETDIYLVDTLGELGLFYRSCPIVCIGGSFTANKRLGGHNPLEPALLGAALLCGPNMRSFEEATARLAAASALQRCAGAEELRAALRARLDDPARVQAAGAAASRAAQAEQQAAQQVVVRVQQFLFPLFRAPGTPHAHA